jgi:hypothetical protein
MHDHEVSTRRILRQQRCNASLTQCTYRWSLVITECYAGSSTPSLGIHFRNKTIKSKIVGHVLVYHQFLVHDKLESIYHIINADSTA